MTMALSSVPARRSSFPGRLPQVYLTLFAGVLLGTFDNGFQGQSIFFHREAPGHQCLHSVLPWSSSLQGISFVIHSWGQLSLTTLGAPVVPVTRGR